jgi:hypothetical protein
MNWTRLMVRAVLLLLTSLLLIYLNVKAGEDAHKIAEFKLAQLKVLMADSLKAGRKFEVLADETKRFSGEIMDDSFHVKKGLFYLTIILSVLAVSELYFSTKSKKIKTDLEK